MIILQIAQDTLQHFAQDSIRSPSNDGHDSYLFAELSLLGVFFLIQIYFFFKTKSKINNLSETFSGEKFIGRKENGAPFLEVPDEKNKSPIIFRIQEGINKYLSKNYGSSVNFHIIQDIIDRETDLEDNYIQQNISVPLYLGLAATMSGIILGLWAMPEISNTGFTESINVLIGGVKWAMSVSLTGLLLTTILTTWIYKPAIQKMLQDKSSFLSMLQAELLPELIRADETGVSGLKGSLENFSRHANEIVNSLHEAVDKTTNNILRQLDIIKKVDELDIKKVSQAVLLQYNKLEKNIEALDSFYENLSQIERISGNLKEFAQKTDDITNISRSINENVKLSTQHIKFLQQHFEKIEQLGGLSLEAVNLTDSHFRDAISKLREEVDNRISKLSELSNEAQSKIQDIYDKIINDLDKTVEQHLLQFSLAYKDAVPKFEDLNYLKNLEDLKKEVTEIKDNIESRQLDKKILTIVEKLDSLKNTVSKSSVGNIPKKSTAKTKPKKATSSTSNESILNAIEIIRNAWSKVFNYKKRK